MPSLGFLARSSAAAATRRQQSRLNCPGLPRATGRLALFWPLEAPVAQVMAIAIGAKSFQNAGQATALYTVAAEPSTADWVGEAVGQARHGAPNILNPSDGQIDALVFEDTVDQDRSHTDGLGWL